MLTTQKRTDWIGALDMYYVYMLRCRNNSLYTGIASDARKRLREHFGKSKKMAKYTRANAPLSLEALWETDSRNSALKIEYQIKRLTKSEKESLILNNDPPERIVEKLLNIELKRLNKEEFIIEEEE